MTSTWLRLCGLLLSSLLAAAGVAQTEIRPRHLGGLETKAAALLLSGQEGGDLDVAALLLPAAESPQGNEDETQPQVLVLDIDRLNVFDGRRLVEIYAYAVGIEGGVGGFLAQGFVAEGPAQARPAKFVGRLDLAPGSYNLRLLVRERPGDRMGLLSLPIEIPLTKEDSPETVAGNAFLPVHDPVVTAWPVLQGSETRWPMARRPLSAEPLVDQKLAQSVHATPQANVPELQRAARSKRVAMAYYGDALRRLAAGEQEAADLELSALEEVLLEGYRPPKDPYLQAVLNVAALIISRSPDDIVPLLAWHERRYREHSQAGRFQLATSSRRIVLETTHLYTRSTAATKPWAALALTSIGAHLMTVRSESAAAQAFYDALTHEPDYGPALLPLASLYEATGDYRGAVDLLENYLNSTPAGNAEAKLRLAINRARLGDDTEAAGALEELLTGPSWIATLAYQELARLHVGAQRHDDAVAVLEKGIGAFPESPRLRIQLAATLADAGRVAASRAALSDVDDLMQKAQQARRQETPRKRYGRWPLAEAQQARRDLATAAQEHLPRLAHVLAGLTPGKKP